MENDILRDDEIVNALILEDPKETVGKDDNDIEEDEIPLKSKMLLLSKNLKRPCHISKNKVHIL